MSDTKFEWKPFIKSVAAIAIPVALQNLLTTTGSMIDTMMISYLGQNELGAVGLCAQFSSLMFSGYWGFVGGGMLFISQFWGSKDGKSLSRSYGLTLTCMMTVAVIFCILAVVFPKGVMILYTDKPVIQEIGVEYLRIAGFSYILMVYSMAMAVLLRCTERVRIPLYGSIVGVAVNIFLNWVLIFGHFGLPRMGVRGAALATVISQACNIIVVIFLAKLNGHPYLFAIKKHYIKIPGLTKKYFKKCLPIIVNEVFMGIGNMIINVVMGRQTEEAIAALAFFRTIEGLVIGFFTGFANASSILVGKEVGAGNLQNAFKRAWRIVYLCQCCISVMGVFLIFLRSPILTLASLKGESFKIGSQFILIYVFFSIIRMGNWTQNDTFRSAGDPVFGTILEIVFMWIMVVPSVWLTGMVFHLPIYIVFICCYADEPIRYTLMQIRLYSGKWIKPVTPEGKAALIDFKKKK
ncbi:MATE efflux family protein [Anaeromyces robustus]|jgi:putative MATE family efflux protein|uniref:Multidrug-efflux transporter n=1 Tax=Anaeromyces robustus TaxID=1754192 RepID=A0A1Y1WPL1_9FUNG|nr:MATE efflux family protein [Anaeromyces robustus]|eukprot:ORX75460.1 MATE efflux family protein [Anaeromyces robustus]